jgi:hypothetical protein
MLSNASPKPGKGSSLIARVARQKATRAHEAKEKAKVRARDKRCRWPECKNCRDYSPRLEVAHLDAKGMGGDHGMRTTADRMMLLCYLQHQGVVSLHSGDLRIETLTPKGTNGPCRFLELVDGAWKTVFTEF